MARAICACIEMLDDLVCNCGAVPASGQRACDACLGREHVLDTSGVRVRVPIARELLCLRRSGDVTGSLEAHLCSRSKHADGRHVTTWRGAVIAAWTT